MEEGIWVWVWLVLGDGGNMGKWENGVEHQLRTKLPLTALRLHSSSYAYISYSLLFRSFRGSGEETKAL